MPGAEEPRQIIDAMLRCSNGFVILSAAEAVAARSAELAATLHGRAQYVRFDSDLPVVDSAPNRKLLSTYRFVRWATVIWTSGHGGIEFVRHLVSPLVGRKNEIEGVTQDDALGFALDAVLRGDLDLARDTIGRSSAQEVAAIDEGLQELQKLLPETNHAGLVETWSSDVAQWTLEPSVPPTALVAAISATHLLQGSSRRLDRAIDAFVEAIDNLTKACNTAGLNGHRLPGVDALVSAVEYEPLYAVEARRTKQDHLRAESSKQSLQSSAVERNSGPDLR